jgi:xanthine dehydrogenase accessory factor
MRPVALRDTAARWLAEGRPAVVVTVVDARGSVPRGVGTRMLVARSEVAGTVGGGHLEWRAIAHARAWLDAMADGAATRPDDRLHLPLGPALGQCCGGAVTLGFASLRVDALDAWTLPPPRLQLQLYGAGHVGRAIVQALAPLHVTVDWIDEREDEFPPLPRPPQVRAVAVDAVEDEVRHAPPGAFYLVLTHSHDLDLRITEAILRRGDFGFLGLIGSATKRARFLRRFEDRGLPPDVLARLTCPIGLPGLTGKEPEVLAASVVAQLLLASSPPAAAP